MPSRPPALSREFLKRSMERTVIGNMAPRASMAWRTPATLWTPTMSYSDFPVKSSSEWMVHAVAA
jgi:hypothetical protein